MTKYIILILMVALMLFIPACGMFKKPILPKNESTIISSATSSINDSTDKIDDIVDGSEYEEPVKVETDNIREETKKLSYEEIEALYQPKFKKLQEEIKEKEETISGLQKLIKDLEDEIQKLKNKARSDQVKYLNWLGGILLLFSGILLYFRQKELAGYLLLGAGGCFGIAQILGSPYFLLISILSLLIVVGGVSYGLYKQMLGNQAETMVMETLEETYNGSDAEHKSWMDQNIFDKLSRKFDNSHKKYVKEKKLG